MGNKKGNPELPDFKQLNDRIVANAPEGPFIGMSTNLDPEDPEKFNPYQQNRLKK